MISKKLFRNSKRLIAVTVALTFLLQMVIPAPGAFAQTGIADVSGVSIVGELPEYQPPETSSDREEPQTGTDRPESRQSDAGEPKDKPEDEPEEEQEGTVRIEQLLIEFVPAPTEEKPFDVITIDGQEARVKQGEIIVRYKAQPQKSGRMSVNAGFNAVGDHTGFSAAGDTPVVYKVSSEQSLEETLEQLREDPSVLYAEPNYELYALEVPNDPLYIEQWGLDQIDAAEAWDFAEDILDVISGEETPVKLAILDTGVFSGHEDLAGRMLSGWNILTNTSNAEDDSASGHGTLVAGIAAASTYNETGIAGTAGTYPVSILPVKVLDSAGVGSMLDVANGIIWAADMGAKVINLSLGARLPDYPVTLAEAVKYAQEKGVLVVAAAGNEGNRYGLEGFYPACLPGVVTAVASGRNNTIASFSNWGGITEVIAPGVEILSTARGNDSGEDDVYGRITGTSAAAPFVSGAAALLWSVFPEKTPAELTDALINSRQNGVMNAVRALEKLQNPNTYAYATIVEPSDNSTVSGSVTLTARVFNAQETEEVVFTIEPENSWDEIVIGTVSIPESGVCSQTWNTEDYPDGTYLVRANVNGYGFGVTLTVANHTAGGLAMTILKPDGTPAAGAKVAVFHAARDSESGNYRIIEEQNNLLVDQGRADQNGRIAVPAALAVNGNDFLVIVQGTEPNFLYHRLLRSPGVYELDPARDPLLAQPVTVTAGQVGGDPLSGALLLADLADVELPEYYYLETGGILSEIPLTRLSAGGTGQVWLTPGNYQLRFVSPEHGYFLRKDLTVGEEAKAFSLIPGAGDVARIRLTAEEELLRTGIQLLDETANAFIGFDSVPANREITVTPGEYTALIDTVKYDNPYDWYLERLVPPMELAGGVTHEIPLGETLRAELHNYYWYVEREYWTTEEYASFRLQIFDADSGGNIVTYLGYQAASPTGQGFSGGNEGPAVVIKPGTAGDAKGPDIFIYNRDTGAFEQAVRPSFEKLPCLEVTGEGITSNNRLFSWPYELWRTWEVGLTSSWIQAATGTYQACATLEAGPFGTGYPEGKVVSNQVSFFVQEPDPGEDPPAGEYGLTVRLSGHGETDLSSSDLVLMEKYGNRYAPVETWAEEISPDEFAYPYFWPEEGVQYAVAIQGYKSGEPLFAFAPFAGSEDPIVIEIDLSGLHRLLVQVDGGAPYRTEFGICGRDGDGAEGRSTFTEFNYYQGWPVWVPEGNYTVQAGRYKTRVASDLGDDILFHLSEDINVTAESPGEITVGLSSAGLVRLMPEVNEAELVDSGRNPDDYLVGGVILYGQDGQSTPFFLLKERDQTIFLPEGSYTVKGLLQRKHHEGDWHYWMEKELNLTADAEWLLDDVFSAELTLDKGNNPEYQEGEDLESTHEIRDSGGNRLIAMFLPSLYGLSYAGAEGPVLPQNHLEVAPFLVVRDAGGTEVLRAKEAQPNYEMLYEWYRDDKESELRAFVPTTSFYKGCFTVPGHLLGGVYRAALELGAWPEGLVTSEPVEFTISNERAAPRLNPIIPGVTSQAAVIVSGSAAPGAAITVTYRLGESTTELSPVDADGNGSFSLQVILPADGSYTFTARALTNGIESDESNPVTVKLDRVAPAAPAGFTGTAGTNSVALRWEAPSAQDADIKSYRLSRNGSNLAEVLAVRDQQEYTYSDSGLTPGTRYTYTLTAIDEAGNSSAPASAEVTTGTTEAPPQAPAQPRVYYRSGGAADIYWPRNADDLDVDYYQVFRATVEAGGQLGDPVALEPRIMADHRPEYEFRDTGLLSQKTYAYTIRAYSAAGTASDPSPAYELTTPELFCSLVGYRLSPEEGRTDLGLINPGAALTIRVVGERGRQASATVTFASLLDENDNPLETPAVRTEEVSLTERPELPGTYEGQFTVRAKITEITAISGQITDGVLSTTPRAAANLPLQVTGSLTVVIPNEYLANLAGLSLQAYSRTIGWGYIQTVREGTGSYTFTSLREAEDYTVTLYSYEGRLLINQNGITVRTGEETTIECQPLRPAGLRVRVLDPEGGTEAVEGVDVSFLSQHMIKSVKTDENGWAESGPVFLEDETVKTVAGYKGMKPWNSTTTAEYRLAAGVNEEELHLGALRTGTITGKAELDTTGEPLSGVIVTATQIIDGRSVITTSVTDGDGEYTLTAPYGWVKVMAGTLSEKYVADNA